jgi:hypothetical protein
MALLPVRLYYFRYPTRLPDCFNRRGYFFIRHEGVANQDLEKKKIPYTRLHNILMQGFVLFRYVIEAKICIIYLMSTAWCKNI